MSFFNLMKSFFSSEFDTSKNELNDVKNTLVFLKGKIEIKNIQRIENIFSDLITMKNINTLKIELESIDSNTKELELKLDDYIGVECICMKNNTKYLYIVNYAPTFDAKSILTKEIVDYPSFKIRNLIVYENEFCIPILETSANKAPIKIDLYKL
ncbi:MAG: hypothetical protein H7331_02140 [Bacteroidia bacterium]|nr:hypothetical protein [Bacteroidia bacterium]